MTRRVKPKQMDISDYCEAPPPRDTGGTTGGERERRLAESNILAVWMWDGVQWPDGGPTEPDVFWTYWLRDEVVNAEVRRQESEGLVPHERRSSGAR